MEYREIADNFFKQTCDMITFNTRQEWLEMRMKGIGGSDVSSIMGHNRWRNRKDIYRSKYVLDPEITNDAIDFGNAFEPIIRESFAYKYRNVYETLDYKETLLVELVNNVIDSLNRIKRIRSENKIIICTI